MPNTDDSWKNELVKLIGQLIDIAVSRLRQLGVAIRQPYSEADLTAAKETIWQAMDRHFGDQIAAWEGLAHVWGIAYLFLNELPGRTHYLKLLRRQDGGRIGEPAWLKKEPAYIALLKLLDQAPRSDDHAKFQPLRIGYSQPGRTLPPPLNHPSVPIAKPSPTPSVVMPQPSQNQPTKPIQIKLPFD